MIDNQKVGKTIAQLRQSRGMTQQQLAAALNVSHQAVSRWEIGAALPDIQTMVELTRFFGITVEQLLNGEVAEMRGERGPQQASPFANIGNFVNGVIQDIGNIFRTDEQPQEREEEDDGAEDGRIEQKAGEGAPVDIEKLLQMAPFLSKEALQEMLEAAPRHLTAQEIAKLAPYVSAEFLEKLIREGDAEINWETLKRIAPFLHKEAVDGLARVLAKGGKLAGITDDEDKAAEDVRRTIQNVGPAIGQGARTAVKNVVQFTGDIAEKVSDAIRDLSESEPTAEERLARIRKAAFERALQDEKWDWIADHISEIRDTALKRRIADQASAAGKQEWIYEHLGGFASTAMIDTAIKENNWGWLGDHVWEFEPEMQKHVALAAMRAENWKWLADFSEQMHLEDSVLEIASNARKAGARMLAVQLVRYDMSISQVESLAMEAVEAEDDAFLDMILELLPQEVFCRCCIRMTKTRGWERSQKYLEKLDTKGVEWMMNLAIDEGNFDAFDQLDAILKVRACDEKTEE